MKKNQGTEILQSLGKEGKQAGKKKHARETLQLWETYSTCDSAMWNELNFLVVVAEVGVMIRFEFLPHVRGYIDALAIYAELKRFDSSWCLEVITHIQSACSIKNPKFVLQ